MITTLHVIVAVHAELCNLNGLFRTPFPHRVSQLLQERLPDLVAAQVTKCFEDNMSQFAVDSERSREQRKVSAHACQCAVRSEFRGSKWEPSV